MARNDGRRVRLPDQFITALCEIIALMLVVAGVFLLFGIGWAVLAAAPAVWFTGWILGE